MQGLMYSFLGLVRCRKLFTLLPWHIVRKKYYSTFSDRRLQKIRRNWKEIQWFVDVLWLPTSSYLVSVIHYVTQFPYPLLILISIMCVTSITQQCQLPGTVLVRGSQISYLLILSLIYSVISTDSVPVSLKSNENAKGSPQFGMKLKITGEMAWWNQRVIKTSILIISSVNI